MQAVQVGQKSLFNEFHVPDGNAVPDASATRESSGTRMSLTTRDVPDVPFVPVPEGGSEDKRAFWDEILEGPKPPIIQAVTTCARASRYLGC